ncbi:MAG: HEAT repeat domain-containing protein [Phycisphaerae bacterium]|nr:HEAT repeat domain-containing protein [Phycisphaerae bacterium]
MTKIQAAFAISNICTSRTISYLPKLLKDDSELVRLSAAKAVLSCMSKFKPD